MIIYWLCVWISYIEYEGLFSSFFTKILWLVITEWEDCTRNLKIGFINNEIRQAILGQFLTPCQKHPFQKSALDYL